MRRLAGWLLTTSDRCCELFSLVVEARVVDLFVAGLLASVGSHNVVFSTIGSVISVLIGFFCGPEVARA